MADHYKILGLDRSATKQQIKDAFHQSALKFHPDRHSQSSNKVRDDASIKFKRASEAYEVLIDDRKRAEYDLMSRSWGTARSSNNYQYGNYGYGYSGSYRSSGVRSGAAVDWGVWLRFFTGRRFAVNMAFASALLGGVYIFDLSMGELWRLNNSGKSFEDAMNVIEKVKTGKEN